MTESLHALSGAYVVDALDDDERAAFEQHLPRCLDCQREVASLREATALLADDAALTPPPSLRASVLADISKIRPLAPLTPGPSHRAPSHRSDVEPDVADDTTQTTPDEGLAPVVQLSSRRRFRIATLVAAAAAVVAVGVGTVYQPWHDNSPPVAQLSPVDQVLNAADAQKVSQSFKDGSTATVYRSPSEGHAVLLTRGMAAPPSGKAFELWLRNKAGVMKPAGMMYTPGDHKVLLKGDATDATGVGITVEPRTGSTTPSSEPIAMFELGKGSA